MDRDGPKLVALLEVGRDLGHDVLGHLGIGLVLEVEHGSSPRLPSHGAEKARHGAGALVGDLLDHRVE